MFEYSSLMEFAGMIYFYLAQLLPFLGIGAAAVIAEGYLIKIGKKKAAVAILLVIFVLGTADAARMSVVTEYEGRGINEIPIWNDMKHDMDSIGDIKIIADEKNQLVGFGKLKITTGKAPKYISLKFDENHRLVGSSAAMKYKKAIESSLETPWKESIEGKSMAWDDFQKLSEKIANTHTKKYISKSSFLLQFFLCNILTFILALIYFVGSYREKRRKASKMDSSKIQDL